MEKVDTQMLKTVKTDSETGREIVFHEYANFDVRDVTHKWKTENGVDIDLGIDTGAMLEVERKNGITTDMGALETMGVVKDRVSQLVDGLSGDTRYLKVEDLKEVGLMIESLAQKIKRAGDNYRHDVDGDKLYPNTATIINGVEAVVRDIAFNLNMVAAVEHYRMQATVLLPLMELYWDEEVMDEADRILTNAEATGDQASRIEDVIDGMDAGGFKEEAMKLKQEYLKGRKGLELSVIEKK